MRAVQSGLETLRSSQTVVLGIICLGVFSTALDQTVVVAALPSVMVDLEIPLTDLDRASWIVTGYLVSYTVAMPLAGRLSDVYGRVRMFQAALVLFAIGSFLVAVAPDFEWVVSARVIQAFGGGATVPIGLAMAVGAVAPQHRGVAIGLVAASAEAGSVLGPLYGGAIIEWIGWRWIFWLDIPRASSSWRFSPCCRTGPAPNRRWTTRARWCWERPSPCSRLDSPRGAYSPASPSPPTS